MKTKPIPVVVSSLGLMATTTMGTFALRFFLGRRRADREWLTRYAKLKDIGAVKRLTILPLIDKNSPRHDLAGEAGVSYLVQADDTTILFDVGFNRRDEHPSPLLRNMQALSVSLEDIDYIFISHVHLDHVGGMTHQRKHSFALSGEPQNLVGKTAFVPRPMTHPTAQIDVVEAPRVIAPGIASLGPISRQLFLIGWTPEQTLAVNVEGKGIVLVSGCGHPTLQRTIDRTQALFDAPLYGVVGGLHYPVTGGGLQRVIGTGKWPWTPVNQADVQASIAYLQSHQPRLVALSPHDSCPWSLQAFQQAFGEAYRDIQIGERISC